MAVYDSILDTIGHTPVVKLQRIAPEHVTLYAKVESFNPGGSVKDRLALAIVLDAEAKGLLKPGDTIIEATSGNTGVALAMVAAARGYKFVATMVETFSIERRKLMRAYGAKVILTPAAARGTGMVEKAKELADGAHPFATTPEHTAMARKILGPDMNLQAPPNLSPGVYPRLIAAGLNDWGGISPVTPDHVNPEAPWPAIDELARRSAELGKVLVNRQPLYPAYARAADTWLAPEVATQVRRMSDAEGLARDDNWSPGETTPPPAPPCLRPPRSPATDAVSMWPVAHRQSRA